MTQTQRTVLLTGFGPFSTVTENPSQHLAESMNATVFGDWICRTTVLDVSYTRAVDQLQRVAAEVQPSCIVMTGVARSASALRAERQALNCADSLHADVDGLIQNGQALSPQLPLSSVRMSSWDIEAVIAHVNAGGHEMYASTEAGGYVCNASYYRALERCEVPVLFIHIPPVGAVWTQQKLERAFHVLFEGLDDWFPPT